MNVKILSLSLMIFAITFSGCICEPEVKYVPDPYEVKVPVKCIVENAECEFDLPTDTEVVNAMRKCIIDMRHNEERCK